MGITAFLTLALWALLLPQAFSLPTHPSIETTHLVKRAGPIISNSWGPLQEGQIDRGIRDACDLAHSGFYGLTNTNDGANRIYNKYFPDGNNGFDRNNVGAVFGSIIQATFDGTTNSDCADALSRITISPDFSNPDNDNEMSCTDDTAMASMRYGRDDTKDPIMIICPNAMKQGNIGPDLLSFGGVSAPPPVTCAYVNWDGLRTTLPYDHPRLHHPPRVHHWSSLVQSRTSGTIDFLTHDNIPTIPTGKRKFYYGPEAVQQPYITQQYGTWIADSYV